MHWGIAQNGGMMRARLIASLSTLCLPLGLLLAPGVACAATYCVSAAGNDAAAGTVAAPWRTIQKAANTVKPGDTVYIRGNGGTYAEQVTLANVNGTSSTPVVFTTYPGDPMAAIDETGVTPPNGTSALFTIQNCNYVTLQNLAFQNFKTVGTNTQQQKQLPVGIYITGYGEGIQLQQCVVRDIWQSCTTLNNSNANGFGIAVYGTSNTPIDGLIMNNCLVYNLRTGASESVTFNGNVTNVTVTNNTVHDCNNIGIDFIGFEGTAPTTALDQVRGGECSGNTVYNIDSAYNPAYGGNFTTGGGDDARSAAGLYVDGGSGITLERNHVYLCNFAVEIASEHQGHVASNCIVRDNIFHHCHVGGVTMGGASTSNGGTQNCSFTNNTIYDNDTEGYGGGQIMIQENVTGTVIQRNIIASPASFVQFVLCTGSTGSFTSGAIDWNLYQRSPTSDDEFAWYRTNYDDKDASWKNAGGIAKDAHSVFTTISVGFANNSPTSASPATDFELLAASPARDAGDSAALPFMPAAGEKDFFGHSRVANARVDIGAHEYMTPAELWRDQYFGLPDGGGSGAANWTSDPDGDGVNNLVEYSQGMNPTAPDNSLAPYSVVNGGYLRYYYHRAAADVTYTVQQAISPSGPWATTSAAEQTDGAGLYWRDIPVGSGGVSVFARLQVSVVSGP